VKIEWAVLARYAELGEDGTANVLGAGLDTLIIKDGSLPVKGEVHIAGRVVGRMAEWREPGHRLLLAAHAPDGVDIASWSIPLRQSNPPIMLQPGEDPGLLLAVVHPVIFATPGRYVISLRIDERQSVLLPLNVREV
jgi:hypothetical protein